jgi:Holliday junction DNA helicase RuvA subunit
MAMIAKLKGRLDSTGIDHAIIDVGGVGYLVGASSRTLAALGPVGEAVTIHTEMLVAEDSIRLVGFARAEERDWYRLLTHVQGVGSRVALAILSALEPLELHRAVAMGDKAMIARANGVGPKLAQRIVNELKDKIGAAPWLRCRPAALPPMRCRRCRIWASNRPRRAARWPPPKRNWAKAPALTRWSAWRCGRRRSDGLPQRPSC